MDYSPYPMLAVSFFMASFLLWTIVGVVVTGCISPLYRRRCPWWAVVRGIYSSIMIACLVLLGVSVGVWLLAFVLEVYSAG